MLRALRTALLAGYAVPELSPGLGEWGYGRYEGLTTAEIRRRIPTWSVLRCGAPGGESPEAVSARCDELLREWDEKSHRHVLCFAQAIFCGRWPPVARAGAGAAFWGASAPGPGQHFPPGLKARSPRPAPGGTTAQAAAPVNGTPGALPASAPLPGIPVRLADAFRRIRCLCPASELQGTPSAASPLQPNPTKLPLLGGVVDRHKGTFRLRPELRRESAALKII